jgi:hypothetical protein
MTEEWRENYLLWDLDLLLRDDKSEAKFCNEKNAGKQKKR